MKQVKIVFILTFLFSFSVFCQESDKSNSTLYTIAYASKETVDAEIYLTDSKAESKIRITNRPGRDGYIAWSPNGKRIASYGYYDGGNTWSIHTMNSDGTNMKRLTYAKNKWDSSPAWSPDGKKIAFARDYQGSGGDWIAELWIMNSDGSEQTQIKPLNGGGPYFTQEGKLVFHSIFNSNSEEICIANIDGSNITKLTNNNTKDLHPEVSADGKQIVFMSNRDGNHEIYVMNIDGSNQKRLTNNDVDDWNPSWSPDGSKIIFQSSDKNGGKHVQIMNNDGSSVEKFIHNAFGAVWLKVTTNSFVQKSESNLPEATVAETKLPFRDIPDLKEAFIDTTPIDRKDGIPVGELGIDGGNKAMILKLAKEIAGNKHDPFDSFLISHKGKLLFESYYSRGRINLPHPQASATKAYTGLALGRAIQLGYLSMADLNKPLVNFLKDLDPTKFVAGVEKITLHQALTMRSGIRINKEQRDEFEKKPAWLKGQGQIQTYLEHSSPITSASQSFKYQMDPELVMQVIDAVVPGTAKDFIKNELLDKMGITTYGWQTEVSSLPTAGWGSSMISRAMVKWGTLTTNKGKWNGEQLVPEAYVAKATSRILYTDDEVKIYGGGKDVSNQGYGYYWWSADLKYGNKSYFSASAQGGGGQYIVLIEELDLMVVVTSHKNDNSTLQIIAERILPAFIN